MDQALALEILLSGESALLTGPAGSGKTHVLNEFIWQMQLATGFSDSCFSYGRRAEGSQSGLYVANDYSDAKRQILENT